MTQKSYVYLKHAAHGQGLPKTPLWLVSGARFKEIFILLFVRVLTGRIQHERSGV